MKFQLCLLFLVASSHYCSGVCRMDKAEECREAFHLALGLNSTDSEAVAAFKVENEEQLRLVCGGYSDYRDCTSGDLKGCHKLIVSALKGIDDLFTDICGDGMKEYLTHAPCFSKPEWMKKQMTCTPQAGGDFCGTFEGTIDCLEDMTLDVCKSQDASDYVDHLMSTALGPLMENMGCVVQNATMPIDIEEK